MATFIIKNQTDIFNLYELFQKRGSSNDYISRSAQEYVDEIAKTNIFEHVDIDFVENLFKMTSKHKRDSFNGK